MKHQFAPVYIWEADGRRRAIGDVLLVATWLTERWPDDFRGSDLHVEAMQACVRELEGDATPDDVRGLFVRAAREADILALEMH